MNPRRALARCDGCSSCESRCPMDVPRRRFNTLAAAGRVKEALELASDCTLCGLCERVCPHGIPHTELLAGLRAEEPTPSAVERALRTGTPYRRKLEGEEEPLEGDVVAVLGCTIRSRRGWLESALRLARRAGLATLGREEPCCLNFARKRGEEVPERVRERWRRLFEEYDAVVVFCPGCLDFCVEVLGERPLYYAAIADFEGVPRGATYKSPCHLVRHGLDDAVLSILPDHVRTPPRRHRCCGGGALVGEPSPTTVRALRRSGEPVITPCPMCTRTLEGELDVRPLWEYAVNLSPDEEPAVC
ncbi:MAG: (Fe-S)-binding protein [Euryarchaeota archaeon]